jgi:hypothetical protein
VAHGPEPLVVRSLQTTCSRLPSGTVLGPCEGTVTVHALRLSRGSPQRGQTRWVRTRGGCCSRAPLRRPHPGLVDWTIRHAAATTLSARGERCRTPDRTPVYVTSSGNLCQPVPVCARRHRSVPQVDCSPTRPNGTSRSCVPLVVSLAWSYFLVRWPDLVSPVALRLARPAPGLPCCKPGARWPTSVVSTSQRSVSHLAVIGHRLDPITVFCCLLKNYFLSDLTPGTYQTNAERQCGILWAINGTTDLSESPKL